MSIHVDQIGWIAQPLVAARDSVEVGLEVKPSGMDADHRPSGKGGSRARSRAL